LRTSFDIDGQEVFVNIRGSLTVRPSRTNQKEAGGLSDGAMKNRGKGYGMYRP